MAVEPRTAKGQATKDKIASCAERVYKRLGRDWFNTEAVAMEAGVNIATVYRYFDNRVALMDHIRPDRDAEGIKEFIGELKDIDRTYPDMERELWVRAEDIDALIEEYL